MKKFYTLLCAAFIAVAAMAQSHHPAVIKGMPRFNPTTEALQHAQSHKVIKKAGGQVMPIDTADPVVLYTNEEYSQPGHYDYYFSFANLQDEFGFPMIFFDLYLPTNEGLQEGTYKMSEGTVDPNLMLMANYNDYVTYYYGYAAYVWTDATITLTKGEGEDVWTVDFSVTTEDDYTYTFNFTGALPVEEDDFDPNAQEPEPEEEYTYQYEPLEKSEMNITFGTPDCSDAYVDEYLIYDIYLDSKQQDANGHNYEALLYLITKEHQPHADFYPVNTSGAQNTFLASQGCSLTSNSKDLPCYLRTYDNNYVYDSWYIVAGYINLCYDADGQVALEGDVETYNGSKLHLATENLPAGINTVRLDSQTPSNAKFIRDGKVYINGGHGLYNTVGQRMK